MIKQEYCSDSGTFFNKGYKQFYRNKKRETEQTKKKIYKSSGNKCITHKNQEKAEGHKFV